MHIPDGILNTNIALGTAVVDAIVLGAAARKFKEQNQEVAPVVAGILAAFVFAAQMLNFPIAAGVSGHFVGAFLLAVLLGPLTSVSIMFIILFIQAIFFQDGGITALGANVLNMGVLAGFVSYYVFLALKKIWLWGAIFVGAWFAVMLGAAACATEIYLSGHAPSLVSIFGPMLSVHAIIGLGEAIITVLAYLFIAKTKPELLNGVKI